MTALLALVLACSGVRPSAAEATHAAASAEHGALVRCLELSQEAVGACVLAGATVAPISEVERVCGSLPAGNARGECWFVVAERLVATLGGGEPGAPLDLDPAISACVRASPFDLDCARHVWHTVRVTAPAEEETVLARIRESFPEHAHVFVVGSAWMIDESGRADTQRAAQLEQAALRGDVMRARWTGRAQRDPSVRLRLCAGTLDELHAATLDAPLFARLTWERAPDADAAVLQARTDVCGADAPSGR